MEMYSDMPVFVSANLVSTILIAIVIGLFILLLLREIMTWYFKINTIVDLLKKIEANTRQQPLPPQIVLPAQPAEPDIKPQTRPAHRPIADRKSSERKITV